MPPKRKAATTTRKASTRTKKAKKQESSEEEDDVQQSSSEEEVIKPSKKEETTSESKRPKRAASTAKENTKNSSEKGNFGLKWQFEDTLYILDSQEIKPNTKFVGFDMDSTLVEPKSGAKFPKSRSDWVWWDPKVPEKLKELNKEGFKIIIFTNQAGIEKNHQKPEDITGKILDLSAELGFPIQAFVAAATDQNRKPNTTMFKAAHEKYNGGVKYDLKACTFVGDAAGRPKGWAPGKSKDFSCGDRAFALNIGVTFKTPEEFFLGESPVPFEWDCIDPQKVLDDIAKKGTKLPDPKEVLTAKGQELVVMVGRPASGKSTFSRKYFVPAGYVHVNQDTLKTKDKCIKATREAIESGKSVVVDNTNPSASARKEFTSLADAKGIPYRCFFIDIPEDLSYHLNYYREKVTNPSVRRIPDVAYNMFKSKFNEPSTSEGFTEVKKIPFVPDFKNEDERKLFLERTC